MKHVLKSGNSFGKFPKNSQGKKTSDTWYLGFNNGFLSLVILSQHVVYEKGDNLETKPFFSYYTADSSIFQN